MIQGDLFTLPPAVTTRPLCSFGETGESWTGHHHCASCCAAVERASEAFTAAVARGEHDVEGYTPKERRAQRRKQAA